MDRWWWTWNMALALSPAAAIAIFMELWGKPYVEKRSKEIEAFQRNKLGLLSNDEEEETYANIQTGNSITSILGGKTPELPASPTPASSQQETLHYPQLSATEASKDSSAAPAVAPDDMSIEALAQRLLRLEEQLERQNRQLEHQRKYRNQRQNQSGIKNRMEDKLFLQEQNDVLRHKQHELEVENSADAGTVSSSPKIFDFAFASMQKNLRSKGEAIMEFGKSVLDPTSETSSDSTSTSSSRNASLAAELDKNTVGTKANVADVTQPAQEAAQHVSVAAQAVQQVSNDVLEQIQQQQNGGQPTSSSWASSWSKIFGAGSKTDAKPSDAPT